MTEIARYTFHIQSNKRSGGTATDMTVNTVNTIALKSKQGRFQVVVHECTVPFSFYQMSSDISTLQCVFTDTVGNPKTANITLTSGNYTTVSILSELSTKLIAMAQITSGAYTGYTPVLNFTYSTTTSKSTLAMTSPVNASIQLKFATNENLGLFFGIASNVTISTASTITGTKVAVANPVNLLLIRSSTFQQTYNREYIVEIDAFSDVLYRCPLGTGANTWIQNANEGHPIIIANDLINSMNFYLTTNLTYNPIDLQGVDWNFAFSIIEIEPPEYITVHSSLLNNVLPPATPVPEPNQEEIDTLNQEYQDNLAKLEVYKKRLEQKKLK
jgi:hypothetical protein